MSFNGPVIVADGAVPTERALAELNEFIEAVNTEDRPVQNTLTVDTGVSSDAAVRIRGLDTVGFDEDSSEISPEYAAQLDRIVSLLDEFPDTGLVVLGRADQRGDPNPNQTISEQRAESVVAMS